MEADFRKLLKCCFFHNWPNNGWVDWWNLPNFPFSIIEIIENKEKWQFFASKWQISIIVEDQIRLWRLYFCAWINRRGDTTIGYFRVGIWNALTTMMDDAALIWRKRLGMFISWSVFKTFFFSNTKFVLYICWHQLA